MFVCVYLLMCHSLSLSLAVALSVSSVYVARAKAQIKTPNSHSTNLQYLDNIELSGIGIFGGEDEEPIQDKSDVSEDESAEYIDEVSQVKEFGVRNPALRRPKPPKQQQEQQEQVRRSFALLKTK